MKWLDLMTEEHRNIKRMLVVMRDYCMKILKNEVMDMDDFFSLIDFFAVYADAHHHRKEEDLLFVKMNRYMGKTAEKMIRHGMLVEHDLGRYHLRELEKAVRRHIDGDEEAGLDIIAHAISYSHLLKRHIDKEDNVLYPYAKRNLSAHTLIALDLECEKEEQRAKKANIQSTYIERIKMFEAKRKADPSYEKHSHSALG